MSWVAGLIQTLGSIEALGVALVTFGVLILLLAHFSEDSKIDFAHTIVDRDGRTSQRRIGEWVALLATTWIVVYMAKAGTLTDWVFVAYIVTWVLRALAPMFIERFAGGLPPPTKSQPRKR